MSVKQVESRSVWAFVPVGLLCAMLAGLATLAVIASRDPGFAIEKDYYQKAVRWDAEQAQRAENARLGWRIDARFEAAQTGSATPLVVVIQDPRGTPVTQARLSLEAFANARAAERIDVELTERADGSYVVLLPARVAGLWELRFSARKGKQRFTQTLRLDAPRGAG